MARPYSTFLVEKLVGDVNEEAREHYRTVRTKASPKPPIFHWPETTFDSLAKLDMGEKEKLPNKYGKYVGMAPEVNGSS
jgi:hypothetical protein